MRGRGPQSRPPSPPRCEDEAGTYGATGARSSGEEMDLMNCFQIFLPLLDKTAV